jgi:arsenite-transporting ATPase
MQLFHPDDIALTKYLFYTGKGGVGKTSIACATAVYLADHGKKVLLISTDPASNLQDVFDTKLDNKGVPIEGIPDLVVANLDPVQAAAEYRESVIAPYRGKLPESAITNMEEQLSGSCTVEIAAFNEFSNFITDGQIASEYDHIIFDTAPTGHTLRMLQLPSAWSGFISESTHGASCLGQLSGLESKKAVYRKAVDTLADKLQTTLILVSRPEETPLKEADRASGELSQLGIQNQLMVINGVLTDGDDAASDKLYDKQQKALKAMPERLKSIATYFVPLRAYNVTGIKAIRSLLTGDDVVAENTNIEAASIPHLGDVIEDLYASKKKVIFTMGKGGVGKTTVAAAIALGLAQKGEKVHLATTDPAAHLKYVISETEGITMSHIDEKEELKKYQTEVLTKARETMSEEDVAYVEEDLRSPCTQEIAVFRAFAEIVDKADNQIVVIDTAPTGHTLLLLDSSQSYHKEVERTQGGNIPESVKKLLPRLRSAETEVIIVTLAETTPVYEAMRLEEDLKRAGIAVKWWVINSSFYRSETTNQLLAAKASHEVAWINKVAEHSDGNFAVIPWTADEVKGEKLKELF